MHKENKRSLRYSYWGHRISKHSQVNVTIGHVSKIPRIYGGGCITAASSSDIISDKEAEDNDFCHDGNDLGGFGGTKNTDESVVQDGCNNEFNVVSEKMPAKFENGYMKMIISVHQQYKNSQKI